MKKILQIFGVLSLGACVYGTPVNNEKFYGNTDLSQVDWSKVDGKGSSCQTNWLFGLIPFGDNSVPTAVDRADLAKVSYIDTDTTLYLPLLMTRECTNVWGELTPSAKAAAKYQQSFENAKNPNTNKPTTAGEGYFGLPAPVKADEKVSAKIDEKPAVPATAQTVQPAKKI